MKKSNPLDSCKRAANCTAQSRRSFLALYLSVAAASIVIATTISVPFQSAAAASARTSNTLKSKKSKESASTGAASSGSEGEGRLGSGSRPRSVIVDNHQPLVDEHITLDSAVRHHLSFVDPDALSDFIVDNIGDEVTFLKKTIPSFEKTCFDLEGPDVDSEDALLRCLKRVYYPTHPIYTGRSGMQRVVGMRHAGLPAPIDLPSEGSLSSESNQGDKRSDLSGQSPDFADGISTRAAPEGQSGMIRTELSALDDELLMSTNGWMPMQLINGSVYLCRMPRSGDNELVESDEDKTFVPKPKRTVSTKSKTKVEGGDEEGGDDQTFEQLKPGQKLPRSLRRELSKRLRGSKCATKAAGWWTYEVCWEDHVRQFHREGMSVTASHYLGQGPNKKVKDGTHADDVYYNVHSVRGPYLSQTLLNGSTCDITGEPRIAEIRLFCDENAGKVHATDIGLPEQASSAINLHMQNIEVSEPETCTYLVWMGSPKACLKQTRKRQGPIFGVRCRNVDDL